jgi:hypothetical protein
MQHVFISYKQEDLDFAENVINKLEKEGFTTWADNKIGIGEEWRTMIDLAIKNAFALIVIMTPEAKASEYVTYEWAFAWGVGIKVIPIMLRPTPLHPRLEALQYLDFTNLKSRPWEKLIEEVKAASQSPLTYSINIPLNSPPYIRQAVQSLDSAVGSDRAGAIETLMSANSQDAYTVLKEALKHPLSDVRQNAASALGHIGNTEAIPALQEALHDPDANVRQNATWALGQIEDSKVIPALQEALHDPDAKVRQSVVWALGHIGNTEAIQALQEALHDPDANVRQNAAQVLRSFENE